jgi:hypothetical protein
MIDQPSAPVQSARDAARYIETLAKDLKRMAAEAELGFLAYLLAMVEDDAGATVRRLDKGEPG